MDTLTMGEGVRLSTCTRQHTRIFCSSRGFTGRYRPRQETEKYPGEVASLHLSDNSHQASGYRSRMNLSPTSIITTFHYIPHASFHHAVIYNTLDNIPHYAGTIPHAAAIARFLAEHNPPALATGPHLAEIIPRGSTVAILGLSYKPFSCVVEESQGIFLAKALSRNNFTVIGFDPLVNKIAKYELKDHIEIKDTIQECLENADAILITTQDPAFSVLKTEDFQKNHKEILVVDFWRMLSNELSGKPGIQYIPVGYGHENKDNKDVLEQMWKDNGA